MNTLINDPIVTMEFPIDENADRDAIARAILENREKIESTFSNNEFLKIDMTRKEIIGIKSTAKLGKMPIGDLPALSFIVSNDEKYSKSKMLDLGNVMTIYEHLC